MSKRMKGITKLRTYFLLVGFFLFSSFLFGEYNADVELFSNLGQIYLDSSDDWIYQSQTGTSVLVRPYYSFDEKFSFDGQLELLLWEIFPQIETTSTVESELVQVSLDLLFKDKLGVGLGKRKIDFGYQGYFQPVRLGNLIQDKQFLFEKGVDYSQVGNTLGVMSFYLDFQLTGWESPVQLQSSLYSIMLDDQLFFGSRNYYLIELEAMGSFWNCTFLGASGGEAFRDIGVNDRNNYYTRRPAFAFLGSLILPGNFLYFSEVLLRQESILPSWEENSRVDYREDLYISLTERIEWQKNLYPIQLRWHGEYWYNGEGMDRRDLTDFCRSQGVVLEENNWGWKMGKHSITSLGGLSYDPWNLDFQFRYTRNLQVNMSRLEWAVRWALDPVEISFAYEYWYLDGYFKHLIKQQTQGVYLALSAKL